jgi:phytoene dehydrogenase-like protein
MPARATQPQTLPREVDYVIVGAGHNGLTAGCYLAREGHSVAVVEASPTVGGMTSTNATLPSAPGHLFNEGAIQLTGIFQLSGRSR